MEKFQVLPKSPRPPMGYRLASVEEAKTIQDWNKLVEEYVEAVRLLDGSLSVPYSRHVEPEVGFKQHYQHMLVNKVEHKPSTSDGLLRKKLYSELKLTAEGRKAALLLSCQDENTEVIYWLLNENAPDKSDLGWLIYSVDITFPEADRKPYVEIIEKLLNFKFKGGCQSMLEESDKNGKTPLHYAVELDNEENAIAVAEFLMEESSSAEGKKRMVNSKDSNKKTPLHIALEGKKFGIFTKLFYLSDSPKDYIQGNRTGLELDDLSDRLQREAARRGYTETVVTLIKECGLGPTNAVGYEDQKSLLDYVVEWENEDAAVKVTELIMGKLDEGGKEIARTGDRDGRTVLHLAARRGHVNLCRQLIKGLSIKADAKDQYGQNSLHLATNEGLVRVLAGTHKEIIYSKDDEERTPLHIAAAVGHTNMVQNLISSSDIINRMDYVRQVDFWGQTALHKAVWKGHIDTTAKLLQCGSRPLFERDSDGKTPLHYACQNNNKSTAKILILLLLKISQIRRELSLLLRASPPGIGTAEECAPRKDIESFLHKLNHKLKTSPEELLRKTTKQGNLKMTIELLRRGANVSCIYDRKWQSQLMKSEQSNVKSVIKDIDNDILQLATDQPALNDSLGRSIFAEGLAALTLNPCLQSPVTVAIFGECGMGKSSLMIQTEKILLETAARLVFPNIFYDSQIFSKADQVKVNKMKKAMETLLERTPGDYRQSQTQEDPLYYLLKKYRPQYHAVFKSLAVMDRNEMLMKVGQRSNSDIQGHKFVTIPSILTVRYNAWQYRNENEAWAGLAVEITKEIEDSMTRAQALFASWKYNWTTARDKIWLELILPCLLAITLGGLVAWAAWMFLSTSTHKPLADLKYGSIFATVVVIVWTVVKSVMDVVKPVSVQMRGYMKLPDHSDKLGYQHKVISDIKFLKNEINLPPSRLQACIERALNWFGACCNIVGDWPIPKMRPAFGDKLRIIVFVDDLDKCEESVILKVLTAVNLVLVTCEINVILAMDKQVIEQAIKRKYRRKYNEDEEIAQDMADKYMRKIFQLPLCLPDPSDEESFRFLNRQLRDPGPDVDPQRRASNSAVQETNEKSEEFDHFFEDLKKAEKEGKLDEKLEQFINDASEETDEIEKGAIDIKVEISDPTGTSAGSPTHAQSIRPTVVIPDYSSDERKAIHRLRKHATGSRKSPRQWKHFLNYHRLAWYILSNNKRVKVLPRWQVQLVVWIFVCWEWKDQMNTLIKKWHELYEAFSSGEMKKHDIAEDEYRTEGEGPSLRDIVKHYSDGAQEAWERLGYLMTVYNVSMDAVLTFQQFRLDCEIGHLKWGP